MTRLLGTASNEQVKVELDYDSVTLLITTLRLINNGPRGTITIQFTNRANGNIVAGPFTRNPGTGTFTRDLIPQNLHMIVVTGRGGTTGLDTPFVFEMEWVGR